MSASDERSRLLAEAGQFRLLVQSVSDYAIYMLDKEGRITSWNLGAQRIKGYKAEEIIGQHFSHFYTPDDRDKKLPETALATAAREGRFEREGWRVRKDGSTFWAHVIIDPIRDDSGETIGFAKITRDITERREAQQKLDRTREALLQSQKMEAIGQLTGGVAHDFNNLLMAIMGSLELMRKRLPDDPKLTTLLENAFQGAQRGATLTRRMLAFARRQELKQDIVDIPELVGGMMELLERSLGPSVRIATRFPADLPPVSADSNQLEMALLNLSVNARDAMPEGGQIVIEARDETIRGGHISALRPGPYVRLSVIDTGIGMDDVTLRRATEPFFTTKGPGKGTGLGLSMVHGLAEQIGGRFTLQSRKNEGTTAELWLPAAEHGETAATQRRDAAALWQGQRPLTVLAVDDDHLVLTNTVAMLEELGHVALAASSGKEALKILRARPVDLLVTDQAMPQMTGAQLADAVAKEWPDTPIIIATGFAEMAPGDAPYIARLAKPFSLEELAALVGNAQAHIAQNTKVVPIRAGNGPRSA